MVTHAMVAHHHPYQHQASLRIRARRNHATTPSVSLPSVLFAIFSLLSFISPAAILVRAAGNVTVDDGDGRIAYAPAGAWAKSAQTSLNYGDSHMLTQNPNATATFSFTGTAIYFLSPLWPYTVNTAVSLDGAAAVLIDLVDHSTPTTGQGSETVASEVVWSVSGLENTQHTLRISVGAGQPFGIVDGLIYTDTSISSSPQSSQPTSAANPITTGRILASSTSGNASAASTSPSSGKRSVPIALGTLFGVLGLLIIGGALWYFCRKRRRPISEAWTEGSYSHGHPNGHHGYGYGAPPGSYGHQLPPQAHGGNSQYDHPQYSQFGYGAPPGSYYGYQGQAGPSSYPGVPPNRAPNRYQPGYTLSTITEKSTPKMGDGTRTMPGTPRSGAIGTYSPASLQSDLVGYYTAPASSAGQYSPPPPGPPGQHSPALAAQSYNQAQSSSQNHVQQQSSRGSEKKKTSLGKGQPY